MGLLRMLVTLPFAPVNGLVAIAEVVRQQVEQEMYSPMAIRRDLEKIEQARADGLISAEEEAEAQQEVLNRMLT
ncbi:MAG: hypothetical protein JWR24_4961 [Actinoallomurus sp.]|jgi:hypothetical protein|nr:hypothetical protein [Actinoallomurus sp.]